MASPSPLRLEAAIPNHSFFTWAKGKGNFFASKVERFFSADTNGMQEEEEERGNGHTPTHTQRHFRNEGTVNLLHSGFRPSTTNAPKE